MMILGNIFSIEQAFLVHLLLVHTDEVSVL